MGAESEPVDMSGQFVKIVTDRFASVEDITSFFGDISGDQSESMVEDAMSGYDQLKGALRGFCADRCVDPTADFLYEVTEKMSESDTCVAPTEFCEGCATAAKEYIMADRDNSMPCCLQKVVDLGISGVDYVRETYGEEIESLKEEIKQVFAADMPEEVEDGEAYYDNALDQAKCFRDMYEEATEGQCEDEGRREKEMRPMEMEESA